MPCNELSERGYAGLGRLQQSFTGMNHEGGLMGIDTQRTVAEIALEKPQAAAVFEKLGIDYCCGGGKPLAAACEEAGIDVNHVEFLLDGTGSDGTDAGNWGKQSL